MAPAHRLRSVAAPILSAKNGLSYLTPLVSSLDEGAGVDTVIPREEALKLMGLSTSSGRSPRVLATIARFGFITNRMGNVSVTEFGFKAVNSGGTAEDYAQAFANVDFYGRVRRKLAHSPVTASTCRPLLESEGVNADEAFDPFFETACDANLIDSDGRFVQPITPNSALTLSFRINDTVCVRYEVTGEVDQATADLAADMLRTALRRVAGGCSGGARSELE